MWTHLAVVYSNTTQTTSSGYPQNYTAYTTFLYVNGVLESTITSATARNTVPGSGVMIAGRPGMNKLYTGGNAGNQFVGFMDEMYIYQSALTPNQIKSLASLVPPPVTRWHMDEGAGITVNDDAGVVGVAGAGLPLTLQSGASGSNPYYLNTGVATWATGSSCYLGKCLYFDGNGGANSAPLNTLINNYFPSGDTSRTVSMWIKPDSDGFTAATSQYTMLLNYGNASGANPMSIMNTNGATIVWGGSVGGVNAVGTTQIPTTGAWTSIIVTVNSTNLAGSTIASATRIYVNGVLDSSTVGARTTGNQDPYGVILAQGYTANNAIGHYKGFMDEVIVWNSTLSQAQITALQAAPPTPTASPSARPTAAVVRYGMDEGKGNMLYDSGIAGLHMNVYNATWVSNNCIYLNCLYFNGSTWAGNATANQTAMSFLPVGTAARSLSLWVNFAATTSFVAAVNLAFYGTRASAQEWGLFIGAGGCTVGTTCSYPFVWSWGVGDVNSNLGSTLSPGVWYNLIATYTATGYTSLYLNGRLIGTAQQVRNTVIDDQGFVLARQAYPGIGGGDQGNYLVGYLDEIYVYNFALHASEVAAMAIRPTYTSTPSPPSTQINSFSNSPTPTNTPTNTPSPSITPSAMPAPVIYYNFDEGSGTTAGDTGSSGANPLALTLGYLPGATWVIGDTCLLNKCVGGGGAAFCVLVLRCCFFARFAFFSRIFQTNPPTPPPLPHLQLPLL